MLSLSTDLDLGNGCAYQLVRLEREALLANCHVQPNSRVSYHRRMRAILRIVSSLCHTFIVLRGVGSGGGLSCLLNFSTTVVSLIELLIHLTFAGQERVFWHIFMLAL